MLVMTLAGGEVMSQMIFSHDTELTLRAACVLVNTDRVDGERLVDQAALDDVSGRLRLDRHGAITTAPS